MKNIVLCCDGTTNEISGDWTNVLRLFSILERSPEQLTYYAPGVGTVAPGGLLTAFHRQIRKRLDAAIGLTIREQWSEAYRFLVHNYELGDRIFLFGFSRGAYTVRAVCGALHMLGLVRRELQGLSNLAWGIYSNEDEGLAFDARFAGGGRFKREFSIDPGPRVHFVGLWDTVSSFGWFGQYRVLPYTADCPVIDHIRHAMALDENRVCFLPNRVRPAESTEHASFKQVWFPGNHSDVGGGYPEPEGGASKVALQWVVREAEQLGLRVDPDKREAMLGDHCDYPPSLSAPLHESLVGLWKALEIMPRKAWSTTARRAKLYGPHFGRRRKLYEGECLHESILKRQGDGYSPKNLPSKYGVET